MRSHDQIQATVSLWHHSTQSGPGCSSLLGMLLENGPYRIPTIHETLHPSGAPSPPAPRNRFRTSSTTGGGALPELVRNDYAWNKHHHVLYVEQPAESESMLLMMLHVQVHERVPVRADPTQASHVSIRFVLKSRITRTPKTHHTHIQPASPTAASTPSRGRKRASPAISTASCAISLQSSPKRAPRTSSSLAKATRACTGRRSRARSTTRTDCPKTSTSPST